MLNCSHLNPCWYDIIKNIATAGIIPDILKRKPCMNYYIPFLFYYLIQKTHTCIECFLYIAYTPFVFMYGVSHIFR
jgi:hypothetical protein